MKLSTGVLLALLTLFAVSGCGRVPASTVHEVMIYQGEDLQGGGSGVMIAPHMMLTAAHIVSGLQPGMTLYVGKDKVPAKVLRSDPEKDVALIMVAMGCPCAVVSEDEAEVDENVTVIGFPMNTIVGLQVITRGNASGVNKDGLIYTAPTAPGNSGGGVFVYRWDGWRLVGLTRGVVGLNMGFSQTLLTHLALAVSAAQLQEFLHKGSVAELGQIKGASA